MAGEPLPILGGNPRSDNARFEVRLRGAHRAAAVDVQVGDGGPGVTKQLRPTLFSPTSF